MSQGKICAGASAGGHMNELIKLLDNSQLWPVQPQFYVTTLDLLASKLEERGPTYVIGECNRQNPFKAVWTTLKCLKIVLQERPDAVITTGSMPLAIFCLLAKCIGARIIWVESIANIDKFSMSGRFVKYFADVFITQWPQLADKDEKAEYVGTLL